MSAERRAEDANPDWMSPTNPNYIKDLAMPDNPLNAFGAYGAATAPPLGAQQLQAIRNEAAAALQAAVDKMQLRKWAVEQAFILFASPAVRAAQAKAVDDPVELANRVYDFVSQAAAVKVDIGQ